MCQQKFWALQKFPRTQTALYGHVRSVTMGVVSNINPCATWGRRDATISGRPVASGSDSRPRVYHASDAPAAPTRPATGRPVRGRRLDQRVAGRDQNLCPRSWSEDTGDVCFLRFSGGWKFLEKFQKEVSADVEIISRKMYVPAWKSLSKPIRLGGRVDRPSPGGQIESVSQGAWGR